MLVDTNAFGRTYDPRRWSTCSGSRSSRPGQSADRLYSRHLPGFNGNEPAGPGQHSRLQTTRRMVFAISRPPAPPDPRVVKAALFAAGGTDAAIIQPYLSWE